MKVLDLTSVIMGPFATQILASLGAEVTKVEPAEGDNMRHVGPMRNPGMGHIFLHANQGKRSIVLDLKHEDGREAALRLAQRSDVLISNVRPQALERLGLGYEAVRERNPRIVHVSCCGFDQSGPYAARAAYDDLIQGATGLPWLMQEYGAQAPCYAPVTLADRVTGLHAVYAVTAALYARERSGQGQAVVVPMYEAMTQFVLGDHLAGLSFDPPAGAAGYPRLLTPHRRPYRTSDGYLCVLIYNDKHWRSFFAAIGEPQRMQDDPRFASHGARAENIDAVYEEVARLMAQRTTAQWRALLDRADVPNMPMNTPQDLLDDLHHQATGFIREVEHPTEGALRTPACPTRWSATPPPADLAPAPGLGEQSVAVLEEAGYSRAEIARLLASGACRAPAPPLEERP
ncbi:formyl-coenzyme A transferase (Formyl-CoA transferase)-like protein [Ramlibacter tataouinensis TTB310]|uniref:Formyl-coenzyme A transferase (Formyl-CoA transferase)-like protein n=1 Tax=Ramlibacter tataouinensis (strain ATCC BAA-407 / DSM 14655 / LMG 21543 / TTB310) TaxID=365046 RepID=F5Y438_RAMTT|nr:formyl-coenzyme A transferase (Formyl-CoA transferase)-like protein [Ramlibacter tataouinensis TTB310]